MKRYLFLTLFFTTFIYTHTVYIIIHGTWATATPWCMPSGDFFDAVAKSVQSDDASVGFLIWSGKNSHQARVQAAQQLINLIYTYPPQTRINLIAHSHGANIGIIASQLLAQDNNNIHSIYALYALGVPVSTELYLPNMNMITYLYNIFSLGDFVQPVLGIYKREFPPHERIANIRVTINNQQPSHSQLHAPAIGTWLSRIHEQLAEQQVGNFPSFHFKIPGIIQFYDTQLPYYEIDKYRELLLEKDRKTIRLLRRVFLEQAEKKITPLPSP